MELRDRGQARQADRGVRRLRATLDRAQLIHTGDDETCLIDWVIERLLWVLRAQGFRRDMGRPPRGPGQAGARVRRSPAKDFGLLGEGWCGPSQARRAAGCCLAPHPNIHDGRSGFVPGRWPPRDNEAVICALTCPNGNAIIRAQIASIARAVAHAANSASERRRSST